MILSSVCYSLLLFSFYYILFIVFLTHMHNRLVSTICTHYRLNADDSTLFNCCCRSNGPIKLFHSHPFDQSDATSILFPFFRSPQGSVYSLLLPICSSDCVHELYTFMMKLSTKNSRYLNLKIESKFYADLS